MFNSETALKSITNQPNKTMLNHKSKEYDRLCKIAFSGDFDIDCPHLIIDWAVKNLAHESHVNRLLALTILSGRRSTDLLYSGYFAIGNSGMVYVKDSSNLEFDIDSCYFIPLCDAELWLESWHGLEKAVNKRHVNFYHSIMISRGFPVELKDLNIKKFKDCRDFYAGVCVGIFKELGYNMPEHFTMKLMGHSTGDIIYYSLGITVSNIHSELVDKFRFYRGYHPHHAT